MATPLSQTFSANNFSWAALSSFSPLQPRIQSHLVNVYKTLAVMMTVAALGVYSDLNGWIMRGGFLTFFATMGSFIAFMSYPATKENENTRKMLLYSFAFFKGMSLAPLIELVGYIDPSILPQAITSTALIFGSFSLAAIFSKQQRGFLYLGGFLMSAISSLLWLSFFNIFMRSRMLFNAELYLGLLVFSLFIVYDTQLIVYKANLGITDHLAHAADLFVDLIGVFVRILIILAKNADKSKKEEKKNRRR